MPDARFADYVLRCDVVDGRHNFRRLSRRGCVTIERRMSGARQAWQASRRPGRMRTIGTSRLD
jgi:hypothetical protein